MELHELDVSHRHAGTKGQGQPVTGRLRGVGGHGVQLSGTTGGEHHVSRPDLDELAGGVDGDESLDPVVADHQLPGEQSLGDDRC